jgi:predicted porin
VPLQNITLNAGVSYTISSDAFYPADPNLLLPVSVASFSELDIRETDCMLSGEYRFKGGLALGLRYKYSNIRNELDNPNIGIPDGTSNAIMLTASKRW